MGQIAFKGVKEGIVLKIDDGTTSREIKEFLHQLDEKDRGLLKGGKVVGIKGVQPLFKDKIEIYEILSRDLNMEVVSLDPLLEEKVRTITKEVEKVELKVIQTKMIKSTVRSGTLIENEGDIIVMGDVNPGAELKSNGNIIVFGSLKGIAHAGYSGDTSAVVIAESLEPTQLRIGDLITRAPDEGYDKPDYPEIAFIKDGQIYIEPTKLF